MKSDSSIYWRGRDPSCGAGHPLRLPVPSNAAFLNPSSGPFSEKRRTIESFHRRRNDEGDVASIHPFKEDGSNETWICEDKVEMGSADGPVADRRCWEGGWNTIIEEEWEEKQRNAPSIKSMSGLTSLGTLGRHYRHRVMQKL